MQLFTNMPSARDISKQVHGGYLLSLSHIVSFRYVYHQVSIMELFYDYKI